MNADTSNALNQVKALIAQLQDAHKDTSLTPQEKVLIENAINLQMDIQDILIQQTLQAMVDKINASNTDMMALMTRMQQTSDKLAKLAANIKKVSDVVGMLAEATTKAISAGLL
ncbi:MAG TPA: hypothetical protein VGM31_20670 [Puia sp.]|jgi:hypothetical protein